MELKCYGYLKIELDSKNVYTKKQQFSLNNVKNYILRLTKTKDIKENSIIFLVEKIGIVLYSKKKVVFIITWLKHFFNNTTQFNCTISVYS